MGRELKRVAPGAEWQRKERDAPLMDEDPQFTPGAWFQMWQTVSGKPYTPAFETAEELARWCADHPWGMEVGSPVPYETWLRFIHGPGWAPSMVMDANGIQSGVDAAF
jgi:hypothetical protein